MCGRRQIQRRSPFRETEHRETRGPGAPASCDNQRVKVIQIVIVVIFATAAFAVAAALVASNARPEPAPCNDTIIIDAPPDEPGVERDAPAPMCAAPEAPASLVLGAGGAAAGGVVGGYSLLVRRLAAPGRSFGSNRRRRAVCVAPSSRSARLSRRAAVQPNDGNVRGSVAPDRPTGR